MAVAYRAIATLSVRSTTIAIKPRAYVDVNTVWLVISATIVSDPPTNSPSWDVCQVGDLEKESILNFLVTNTITRHPLTSCKL